MRNFFTDKRRFWVAVFFSGLIGGLFFFFLYGELVNPTYIDWILTTGGDPFQHYIGWEFFRESPWTFPIGINQNYGYPVGVPISFTDSIPLLAFLLKPFSAWLPEPFQYLGIWMGICFVLQGIFGFLLLESYTKRKILSILGSIFFIVSPVMLLRLGGHTALGSHWLLLASLYLSVREHDKFQTIPWAILFALSLLIHPYLFIMMGFVMIIDVLNILFVKKTATWKECFFFLVVQVATVLLVSYCIGLFYIGESGVDEYGQYSMNLNALWNPVGWSRMLLDKPLLMPYQNEGFNYLGVGIITLLGLSGLYAFLFVKNKWQKIKRVWPFLLVSFLLFLIAITNKVIWGQTEIFSFPLPRILRVDLLGIVRASGRMFWPVYYLLFMLSFFLLKKKSFRVSICILVCALGLQLYDLSSRLNLLNHNYENRVYKSYLVSPFWQEVAKEYKHVSFIPDFVFGVYEPIVLYAAQNHLTVNIGYFARPIKGRGAHIETEIQELRSGTVRPDTLYVFQKNYVPYVQNIDVTKHLLGEADYYNFLAPSFKESLHSVTVRELSRNPIE